MWLDETRAASTRRFYQREAERVMRWAVFERRVPLSSLTVADAAMYVEMLNQLPPYGGSESALLLSRVKQKSLGGGPRKSTAYASFTVVRAMFKWLVRKAYLRTNVFAELKVGQPRMDELKVPGPFTWHEWTLIRPHADCLEREMGWPTESAQRFRFLIDFCQATALPVRAAVALTLGSIVFSCVDHTFAKSGTVFLIGDRVLIPVALQPVLRTYLFQRGLPQDPEHWCSEVRLVGSLEHDGVRGVRAVALERVAMRFFEAVAWLLEDEQPRLAEKLRRAGSGWKRDGGAQRRMRRDEATPAGAKVLEVWPERLTDATHMTHEPLAA